MTADWSNSSIITAIIGFIGVISTGVIVTTAFYRHSRYEPISKTSKNISASRGLYLSETVSEVTEEGEEG